MKEITNDLVSIIIPCKTYDDYVKRCVHHCNQLQEPHEIIVVSDPLCPGYPAEKRNWAMKRAKGKVFAFIDSDAYPHPHWLENSLYFLNSHDAVCGPGVLPPDAPFMEKVADWVYQHLPYSYRVRPGFSRIIAEYPTFNLVVKKEVATKFDDYLTGEDSLFCRRIPNGIFYSPLLLVYHNRRPAFRKLWRQVATYGKHRGNFIKLALLAWITTVFTYAVNFVKGFFTRRPS